jgi:hypothetical protein
MSNCRSSPVRFEFRPGIAAIGEDMTQPGKGMADCLEDAGSAITILDVGRMDVGTNEEAAGVGEDVALASLDLFVRIITGNSTIFRGFDRLAVKHAGRGRGFATRILARRHQQGMVDRLPEPAVAPSVEIMLHGGHWREQAWRQHPPGNPAAQNIEHRLDDRAGSPTSRDDRVLCVPAIEARSAPIQHLSTHLAAGNVFGHVVPGGYQSTSLYPWLISQPHESQLTDITQLLFRSGSRVCGESGFGAWYGKKCSVSRSVIADRAKSLSRLCDAETGFFCHICCRGGRFHC